VTDSFGIVIAVVGVVEGQLEQSQDVLLVLELPQWNNLSHSHFHGE
jgi:hypothetical protein